MSNLVKVGSLPEGTSFMTPLTRRSGQSFGVVASDVEEEGGVAVLLRSRAGAAVESKTLHPDVLVEAVH